MFDTSNIGPTLTAPQELPQDHGRTQNLNLGHSPAGWCKYINAYQILFVNYEVYRIILFEDTNSYEFSVASITSGRVCSPLFSFTSNNVDV